MPPKKKRFESRFPTARIKKIMQLDDDVGKVAASVPLIISRAVEMFLQKVLSRADEYASSRQTKTITVQHIKHCIDNEKEWDFLKALVSKIPDINSSEALANEEGKKRGRKRKVSATAGQEKSSNKLEVPAARKRKRKGSKCSELKHTEDNNISGSSGADDNAQEVQEITSTDMSCCSNLPIIQAAGVIDASLAGPSPTITVATGSGMLQQLPMSFDDTATPRLFSNRTDDSDDDYDI